MGAGLYCPILTCHALSPGHYLFRHFLKAKKPQLIGIKSLSLPCIHVMSVPKARLSTRGPDWLSAQEAYTYIGDLMHVHSRFKISSMWFFYSSFALGLLSDWKSKNHSPIPENTLSFPPIRLPAHHTFLITCLIYVICKLFCRRVSVLFGVFVWCWMSLICWPLDKSVVKIAAIILLLKEAPCLNLVSCYKIC